MRTYAGGLAAHLSMLLYVLMVSTSFPVGAAITHALDPVALSCVRFAMAAVIFGLLITISRRWRRPGWRDAVRYVLLAGTLVGFFVAMFEALRLTSTINTSALFTLMPLFSVVIALPLLRQRTPPVQLAFMAIAAFGALWVVFKGSFENALALKLNEGDLIFAAGCVSFAAFAPLARRLDVGENLLTQTFWTLVAGTIMLAVVGADSLATASWADIPDYVWLGVAYLAVFTTAVTFYLLTYSSQRLPAAKVMSYYYLTPAFVMVLETVSSGVAPAGIILIGAGIAILATLLLQISTTAK